MKGLFFTGTDTGVGKTVITSAVARILRARRVRLGVCKPVATGAECINGQWLAEDTRLLARAAGLENEVNRITPWVFPDPLAPPVAAVRQGKTLVLKEIASAIRSWHACADFTLVEGVGGLLCPLTESETVADLAQELALPLIVVARTTLGTLNHTLLTVEAARRRQLHVSGVILNEVHPPTGSLAEQTNVEELRRRLPVPILAVVLHRPNADDNLFTELESIEWTNLA